MTTAIQNAFTFIIDKSGSRLEATIYQDQDQERYRFQIDSPVNDVGVLYRISAVLYANGWDIHEADIKTPILDRIQDDFTIYPETVDGELIPERMKGLMKDLERVFFGEVSVVDYLSERSLSIPNEGSGDGFADLTYDNGKVVIEIITGQQKWLLLSIFQAFYLMDVNIKEASIHPGGNGTIRNRFLIATQDYRYHNPEFRKRLREELKAVI